MNRTQGWVALVVLGFAFAVPASLYARSSKHPETNKQVQKSSKQYNKQMRKEQKRQAKLAKKQAKQQAKQNEKLHPGVRRQTVKHSVT